MGNSMYTTPHHCREPRVWKWLSWEDLVKLGLRKQESASERPSCPSVDGYEPTKITDVACGVYEEEVPHNYLYVISIRDELWGNYYNCGDEDTPPIMAPKWSDFYTTPGLWMFKIEAREVTRTAYLPVSS